MGSLISRSHYTTNVNRHGNIDKIANQRYILREIAPGNPGGSVMRGATVSGPPRESETKGQRSGASARRAPMEVAVNGEGSQQAVKGRVAGDPQNSVRYRYTDQTAAEYDRKRARRRKWRREMDAIDRFAASLAPRATVLDCPAGTGRFIPLLLSRADRVYGLDISHDMLRQAEKKIADPRVSLLRGDSLRIPLRDKAVDCVVCIRLLNWVREPTMEKMVAEFVRVARGGLILGFRSRRRMTPLQFAGYGLVALLPTPQRLQRQWKRLGRFANRVRGKLLHEARRLRPAEAVPAPPPARGVFLQTHYDEEKVLRFLAGLGLELVERQYIDTIARHGKLAVYPYSIYRFRLHPNAAPPA